jgi:hypothetical protein
MLRSLAVTCVFLLSQSLYSQQTIDSGYLKPEGTRYIARMDTVMSIRLNFNNEHERFLLNGSDFRYDIRPSFFFSNRISFNYRIISFGVGFRLRFLPGNNGNSLTGNSKGFFLRLGIFTKHWQQELQFGRMQGFYLFNTGDYMPGWTKGTDPYIQFPGLRIIAITGATSYKLNHNFSMKALANQNEIQLKSCGSLIPAISYSCYLTEDISKDTSIKSKQKSASYEAVLNLGYYYTFVLGKRFYLALGLAPGCGANFTHLTTLLPDEKIYTDYFSPVFRLQERLGIGYNSRKFFGGVDIAMVQATRDDHGKAVQQNSSRNYFQVFIGYRFNAPAFLRKKTSQVEDLIPVKINGN